MEDDEFEKLVAEGIDAIPKEFTDKLNNVAIVIEDAPAREQIQRARLHRGWTLFGLYQGIPLNKRMNYTMVLPDKITIFKLPILWSARSEEDLREIVRNTVWHEIAHHFGMDESEVMAAEARRKQKRLSES